MALHPGRTLRKYLKKHKLTGGDVARLVLVPRTRIYNILAGKTGITSDSALRLGKLFGTGPQMWQSLQIEWDLSRVSRQVMARINKIEPHPHYQDHSEQEVA